MNEKDTNLLDFISTMQGPQEVSMEGITASSGRRPDNSDTASTRKEGKSRYDRVHILGHILKP